MNRRQNQCGAVFAFLNKTTCTRVEMNAKQVRQSFLPENSSDNPLKKSSLISGKLNETDLMEDLKECCC